MNRSATTAAKQRCGLRSSGSGAGERVLRSRWTAGHGSGTRRNRVTIEGVQSIGDSRFRGVAQSGSASALGAEGRWFESSRPDHSKPFILQAMWPVSATHLLFTATQVYMIL